MTERTCSNCGRSSIQKHKGDNDLVCFKNGLAKPGMRVNPDYSCKGWRAKTEKAMRGRRFPW